MKKAILFFIITYLSGQSILFAQSTKSQKPEDQISQYWFVMLTKGTVRSQDSTSAAKIQEGHMANIHRLYYEGKLKVAGPFGDDGDPIAIGWLGIFIFDPAAEGCKTKEDVEKLLKTDPAIAAGRLNYEIHPWWTASMGSFKHGKPETK